MDPILKREGREANPIVIAYRKLYSQPSVERRKGLPTVARLAEQEARRGVSEEKNHQKTEFNQANKRREVFKQVGEPA